MADETGEPNSEPHPPENQLTDEASALAPEPSKKSKHKPDGKTDRDPEPQTVQEDEIAHDSGWHQSPIHSAGHKLDGMNAPDRFELFLLGEGEKKCSEEPDTRTPNSSVFTFNKEDHTLANMLRAHLLKDPHVIFSGYKIPHPLFAKFELRVQTDGEVSPKEALLNCCKSLVSDLEILGREFTKEYELRKMVSGDVNGADR